MVRRENSGKRKSCYARRNTNASISKRLQEIEEGIFRIEETIEERNSALKENVKSKTNPKTKCPENLG